MENELLKTIGSRFKVQRLTVGVSVNQMSKDCKIGRRTLQNFEAGRNAIGLLKLFDMADYLGLSVEFNETKKPQ